MHGAYTPLLFLNAQGETYLCRACAVAVGADALELTESSVLQWYPVPPWEVGGLQCSTCGRTF